MREECTDCTELVKCVACSKGAEGGDEDLAAKLRKALGKIYFLAREMKNLSNKVEKLEKSKEDSSSSSDEDSGDRGRKVRSSGGSKKLEKSKVSSGSSSDVDSGRRGRKGRSSRRKKKKGALEDEKARQLRLMKAKLKDRSRTGADSADDESSDASLNLAKLKKKMDKDQKRACEKKLAARLTAAGARFPIEDFESTGTDSSSSDRDSRVKGRRKVKSGAKVKKRPVIRTELWPHTIANEDDGEDITSENIGLAKFLSCFTFIMNSCRGEEAAGRAVLLQAVSTVLECQPWSEARTFHNLVMVKVEQGRMDWSTDFALVADQFLDKKVRLNLRGRGAAAGTNSSSARTSYSKNFGKGFSAKGKFSSFSNKSKSLYSLICRQWNYGTCGYGDRCRKWHACWSCAEAGKPGEEHKASSHDGAFAGNELPKQRG